MRVLALDTSSMAASVALVDDERVLGEITFNYKRQHSTILIPMIDRLLDCLDMDIGEADCISCTGGPGSFTGLRIGAATAKGLCRGAKKPFIAIPTLDSLAYNMAYTKGIVCPIMDALRGNVYTGLYKWEGGIMVKLHDYMAVSIDELVDKLGEFDDDVVFLGDGVPVYKDKLTLEMGARAGFAPVHLLMQRASSAAYAALRRLAAGDFDDYESFAPFYLRKPQAEREYEKSHGGTC